MVICTDDLETPGAAGNFATYERWARAEALPTKRTARRLVRLMTRILATGTPFWVERDDLCSHKKQQIF